MHWKSVFYCVLFIGTSELGIAMPSMSRQGEMDWCAKCHGNQAAESPNEHAPMLAKSFSMTWEMFEFASKERPPFVDIPKPFQVIHGETYYDWDRQSMTEIYRERCIEIFPEGRDDPCQFLSVGDTTYLIRFNKDPKRSIKSCDVWPSPGFWAPRPDVLKIMEADTRSTPDHDWWILDISLPGPFGYGQKREDRTPTAFWFPVLSGWVQQNFANYSREKPPSEVFKIPLECLQ